MAVALGVLLVSTSTSALNIALTNDDGWDSMGIRAMKAALVAGGHKVTLVAPLDGQSGSSAGMNLGSVEITKQAEGEYSVALPGGDRGAEPATCALLAMDIAGQPDLLVSGINDGANTGPFTQMSGTVGAAIAALNASLNGSLPAIAISTNKADCAKDDKEAACQQAHFDRVAAFTAQFIGHLESKPGFLAGEKTLLPPRIGLNINYPPTDTPRGVRVSVQGQTAQIRDSRVPFEILQLNITCDDCAALPVGGTASGGLGSPAKGVAGDVKNGDAENFANDYITIVPIQADYTAPSPERFESVVKTFKY
jgi:5'-nucleotidase